MERHAQRTASRRVTAGAVTDAQTRNEDALRAAERVKGVKALTKSRRPVLWPDIRKRNPYAHYLECENKMWRQCCHEFAQFGFPEWRAWLEKHSWQGQPVARQSQHVEPVQGFLEKCEVSQSPETRRCDPSRLPSSCVGDGSQPRRRRGRRYAATPRTPREGCTWQTLGEDSDDISGLQGERLESQRCSSCPRGVLARFLGKVPTVFNKQFRYGFGNGAEAVGARASEQRPTEPPHVQPRAVFDGD